ncbi:MAG: AhpC/TSA family protein [Bacteroidia bacterium]|nr:MAG: AhpC/TSA family protein [Bacteroidia bacterium]
MKKLFFFLSLIALVSCSDKGPVNQSTITGTVLNNPTDYILLSQMRSIDTLMVNEDGTFSIVKTLDKPGSYYLQTNKKFAALYLEPGKNLEITFDANDFDATLAFAGDLALENRYAREIGTYNNESGRISRDLYLGEPEAYRTVVTEQRQAKDKLLNDFMSANPGMSKSYINNEGMGYEFGYYSALLNYEEAHKYYAKVEEVILPEDWYSFMTNIDINNAAYLDNPACLNVVSSIISKGIDEASDLGDDAWGTAELTAAQFEWVNANITDPAVSDYFLNSFLTEIVDYQGPSGIEQYVNSYIETSTNEENKKAFQEKIVEWAPLTPGNDAPTFTLPDINGNEVSLADFAGKYVYIDFWATWCGPCKIEIPVLAELAVEYKDKNLVIVSISVDKDKQAWIDMITNDKPEWLQIHDGVNMNDDYLVKYIPTFVLLDREGKILNPRAPRPSSGEKLTSLFNSLEGI